MIDLQFHSSIFIVIIVFLLVIFSPSFSRFLLELFGVLNYRKKEETTKLQKSAMILPA